MAIQKRKKIHKKEVLLLAVRCGVKFGIGHVRRSQVLAELFEKHFQVFFWAPREDSLKRLMDPRWKRITAPNLKQAAQKCHASAILCDVYKQPFSFFRHDSGIFLGALDFSDYANPYLNVIIELHSHRRQSAVKRGNQPCALYSGNQFAIIRDDFFPLRKKYRLRKKVRHIFVWLGGSDPDSLTMEAVKFLKENMSEQQDATVILGDFNQDKRKIRAFVRSDKRFKIMQRVKDHSKMLPDFDLALCSAGGTLMELSFLGIPALAMTLQDWEKELLKKLSPTGFALEFPPKKTARQLRAWKKAQDFSWREKSNKAGRKVFDGLGKKRIVNAFLAEFEKWKS